LDDRIVIHIQVVIVVDKLVTQRLAEDHPDDRRQKMQTPVTSQRLFKPATGLSDFSKRESPAARLSPAGNGIM